MFSKLLFSSQILVLSLGFLHANEQTLAKPTEIVWMPPEKMICPERFSLFSKYIFVKFYDKQLKTRYHYNLYKSVLKVMSPRFQEGNPPTKTSYKEYEHEFINLISSIKRESFNPSVSTIPYRYTEDQNRIYYIDGDHRVASALHFGIPLACTYAKENNPVNRYNSLLFLKSKVPRIYLDHMAFEYIKKKEGVYMVLLYKQAMQNPKKAIKLLENEGRIVYSKEISLNTTGGRNLVKILYENEPQNVSDFWRASRSPEAGKTSGIMKGDRANFLVIVWECDSLERNKACKKEIREAYPPFSHNTLHITDTKEETIYAAQTLLNDNSIDLINKSSPKEFGNFIKAAKALRKFIAENPQFEEDYVIDTGSVLSAYGLRESQDLDIICNENLANKFTEIDTLVDIHNSERLKHGYNLDDLIYNPKNYFYFKGLRFLTKDVIIEYKKNRKSGGKDQKDIALLQKLGKA